MTIDEQVPSKLDPGTPIDCSQTYFLVWVQAVRLYKDPSRGGSPLNSKADLFEHINRFYRPRPEAKTRPNPSFYLSKMKKLGMMRMFGERGAQDNFWAPETDIVLRVNGKVVYTPEDLPELLAGGKRFLFAPEPDRPTKVPRARRPKSERVQAPSFEDVHQVLWSMAQPTSSMDERILLREAAIEYIVGVRGTNYAFAQLFRHGRLRAAPEADRVLVIRPTLLPAPAASEAVPAAPEAPVLDSDIHSMSQEDLAAHEAFWVARLATAQDQIDQVGRERKRRLDLEELKAKKGELEQRRQALDEEERDLARRLQELGAS